MNRGDIFIENAKSIHGNKYDYSLIQYKNNRNGVEIICPLHGVFKQTPYKHLMGRGCHRCANNQKLTDIDFITKSNEIHGNKYDYSLVRYKNNKTKIEIICPIHGVFRQSPNNHISKKQGCPKCGGGIRYNQNEYIDRVTEIHDNKYDYSLVRYKNNKTKIEIICPIHGIFRQNPDCHLNRKYGCPKCSESKGEKEIRLFLEKNDIKYIYQKTFEKCRLKNKLKFDYYLCDYNICIEYNGIQHYKPIDYFGGKKILNYQKNNDQIKYIYCMNNNINLSIIRYDDDILEKLKNIINI